MDKMLQLSVPIQLKGEALGVKTQGGILDFVLREIEIECLPGDSPSYIEGDVSSLVFGQGIRVTDLVRPERIKFLTDSNQLVAHVVSIKEEVAPTVEAATEEAAAGAAEPEIIKKGKGETEGEEAKEGKKEAKESKK
jgi:large subunit ribosomal protein L25